MLDVNGRELDKGFYSGTAKAIEYSLDTYASGNYYINIYAYNREEGVFCSVLSGPSALPVLKSELGVELVEPRSYVKNVVGMEKSSRRLKGYLQEEINIETTDENIVSLAESIVSDSDSDYEKAHKIHAWITENITYDEELADNPDVWYRTQRASAIDVLKERKGVCAGIANLLAALLRSQGVPVRKVNGYALENDELCWNETNMNRNECNHAWNEVFAEDRWILVDTTWDIDNEVHLYFDCTPEFFSYTHAYLLENK